MLFNSINFAFFFVVVTTLYFVLPHKFRWFLLLAASCYFYMAFIPIYLLILVFTIVIDYFAGIWIAKSQGKKRKSFLIASLLANIGVLAIFKYYNFLNDSLSFILDTLGTVNRIPHLGIILPIGLSFHTFQAMSYTIEVYRGHQKAERNFGIYALYVMFYPQLVAGPIERPQNLIHQFYEKHSFDYQRVTDGLKLMAWGLFKKVVIADRLAIIVDTVYNDPINHNGLSIIIASIFFTFQVFCDFSGYSDMAIGAAQVMGFKLMKNFDRPFHSKSIAEFWKRWHISLSTWFRDYMYFSMGGSKVSIPRWYFNLFLVFLVSGLWHGASWNYVIWGAMHGFFMVFAIITQKYRDRFNQIIGLTKVPFVLNTIQVITTFSLLTFSLVVFRANSMANSVYMIKKSLIYVNDMVYNILHRIPLSIDFEFSGRQVVIGVLAIILMEYIHVLQYKVILRDWIRSQHPVLRWSMYYAAFLIILFFGVYGDRQFIYFQF